MSDVRVDWSPSQNRLAISIGASYGGIFLSDPDGQNSLWLTEGRDARWSPDGERLAYFHGGLYVIDRDGSNVQCIYDPPAFPRDISPKEMEDLRTRISYFGGSATWSPDGRYLAFGGDGPIYIVDLETKEIVRITEPLDGLFDDPDWSP
jgi:Tol biopolymer transport system component